MLFDLCVDNVSFVMSFFSFSQFLGIENKLMDFSGDRAFISIIVRQVHRFKVEIKDLLTSESAPSFTYMRQKKMFTISIKLLILLKVITSFF